MVLEVVVGRFEVHDEVLLLIDAELDVLDLFSVILHDLLQVVQRIFGQEGELLDLGEVSVVLLIEILFLPQGQSYLIDLALHVPTDHLRRVQLKPLICLSVFALASPSQRVRVHAAAFLLTKQVDSSQEVRGVPVKIPELLPVFGELDVGRRLPLYGFETQALDARKISVRQVDLLAPGWRSGSFAPVFRGVAHARWVQRRHAERLRSILRRQRRRRLWR